MNEPMRRTRQQLTEAETVAILDAATSGVLAVIGADGYPYAVPLSFALKDGSLYFHCAKTGHKIDAIANCDRASFCVIADDHVVQETFTTHYRSAIVFGRVSALADERKRDALMLLAEKYSPEFLDAAPGEIDGSWDRTVALELTVEEMTGKAAMEVIKQREATAKAAE